MTADASFRSAQSYAPDPRNEDVLVYVNGAFVPRHEARVSVFDSGFVLGDGVWEGLRLVNGTLINDGTPVIVGIVFTMAKIARVSTPAVPRSKRLSPNLVMASAPLVSVCPGVYPTSAPAAT